MMTVEKTRYISKIKEKQHFVYRWVFADTGEYYIGKHSGHVNDNYIASGKLFWERYGSTDQTRWERTILGYYPSADAAYYNEGIAIGTAYRDDPLCLNLVAGGGRLERSLKPKEYRDLVKNKYSNSIKSTIAEWMTHEMIGKYMFTGSNLNGQFKWFDTTPLSLKRLIVVAKEASTLKFDYEFIYSCFDINENSILPSEDCQETMSVYGKEAYKQLANEIARIVEIYNDRYNKDQE